MGLLLLMMMMMTMLTMMMVSNRQSSKRREEKNKEHLHPPYHRFIIQISSPPDQASRVLILNSLKKISPPHSNPFPSPLFSRLAWLLSLPVHFLPFPFLSFLSMIRYMAAIIARRKTHLPTKNNNLVSQATNPTTAPRNAFVNVCGNKTRGRSECDGKNKIKAVFNAAMLYGPWG
jgi:hypothetical protein